MNKYLNEFKNNFIFVSIAFFVLGILLVVFPEISGLVISYICATALTVIGIIHIADYFRKKNGEIFYNFTLARGIIEVVIGIFIFIQPKVFLSIFPIVLGIIVLIDGVIKVQNAINLKRCGNSTWWSVLALAVIGIILGALMIINPFTSTKVLFIFLGIALIVSAVSDIYTVIKISNRIKDIKKNIDDKANAIDVDNYTVEDDDK